MLPAQSPRLYLLSGHGSDERLFQALDFPGWEEVYLPFLIPEKGETMATYARRMAAQVDTTRPFVLMGVSLGGMVAVEMTEYLHPQGLVLIASAQQRADLPWRYRFQTRLPLYQLLPGRWLRAMGSWVQPLFEPGSRAHRELCRSMVLDKDPRLMKRGIHLIIQWQRPQPPEGLPVLHLHGPKDTTLPLRAIQSPHEVVPQASHMMALLLPEEVEQRVKPFLRQLPLK